MAAHRFVIPQTQLNFVFFSFLRQVLKPPWLHLASCNSTKYQHENPEAHLLPRVCATVSVQMISRLSLPGRFLDGNKLCHVHLDAARHILSGFVLPVIVDEITIRIDEVRNDGVIHLFAQSVHKQIMNFHLFCRVLLNKKYNSMFCCPTVKVNNKVSDITLH